VDNKKDTKTFVMFRPRAVDRLFVRLKSAHLDHELAAGNLPQSSRLHAARADTLTSSKFRAELAGNWERVLQIGTRRTSPGQGRFVLSYERIAEAEPQIRELTGLLRGPSPVPARGVAAANLLLSDGAGPLYIALHADKTALANAVMTVVSMLDPTRPPMS
jgi:hypothetical protein